MIFPYEVYSHGAPRVKRHFSNSNSFSPNFKKESNASGQNVIIKQFLTTLWSIFENSD